MWAASVQMRPPTRDSSCSASCIRAAKLCPSPTGSTRVSLTFPGGNEPSTLRTVLNRTSSAARRAPPPSRTSREPQSGKDRASGRENGPSAGSGNRGSWSNGTSSPPRSRRRVPTKTSGGNSSGSRGSRQAGASQPGCLARQSSAARRANPRNSSSSLPHCALSPAIVSSRSASARLPPSRCSASRRSSSARCSAFRRLTARSWAVRARSRSRALRRSTSSRSSPCRARRPAMTSSLARRFCSVSAVIRSSTDRMRSTRSSRYPDRSSCSRATPSRRARLRREAAASSRSRPATPRTLPLATLPAAHISSRDRNSDRAM